MPACSEAAKLFYKSARMSCFRKKVLSFALQDMEIDSVEPGAISFENKRQVGASLTMFKFTAILIMMPQMSRVLNEHFTL